MPLLDHFHPPLSVGRPWQGLHAGVAASLAAVLNHALDPGYTAIDYSGVGPGEEVEASLFDAPTAAGLPPPLTLPAAFADDFGVEIVTADRTRRLVAAIELVTPRQKATAEARRGFAARCAGHLYRGVSLLLLDFVTGARANLHNEIMQVLGAPANFLLSQSTSLYAVAYRPARRQKREEIDLWSVPLTLGETLPTLPLALGGERGLLVDLEGAYMACWRKRKSYH